MRCIGKDYGSTSERLLLMTIPKIANASLLLCCWKRCIKDFLLLISWKEPVRIIYTWIPVESASLLPSYVRSIGKAVCTGKTWLLNSLTLVYLLLAIAYRYNCMMRTFTFRNKKKYWYYFIDHCCTLATTAIRRNCKLQQVT